jgi:ribonuclease H2 subunit A
MTVSIVPPGPCTVSWGYSSPIPLDCKQNEPCILGVDEAGRGPVLGPMVYSVAFTPVSKKDQLKDIGFDDSKVLTAVQREQLFDKIQLEGEWIGWSVHALSPQDISESMLRVNKYNLNAMAHDTTINLIKKVLEQGINIEQIYVDTVGPPDKYQIKLKEIFPGIQITVAKKADSIYPIVSAASICAKVIRDDILSNWEFVESRLSVSNAFGSGYPSGNKVLKRSKHSSMVKGSF